MRKAIFTGAVVVVLTMGGLVLADHGGHRQQSGIVGWSNLGDFGRSQPGHFGPGEGILQEVLAEMVSEGTLAQVQSDAIMSALQEKREELTAARTQTRELLKSFWDDEVLTEDEIDQLPMADHILQLEGVSEALADGQITRAEAEELLPGKGKHHRGGGSRGHGRGRH